MTYSPSLTTVMNQPLGKWSWDVVNILKEPVSLVGKERAVYVNEVDGEDPEEIVWRFPERTSCHRGCGYRLVFQMGPCWFVLINL